MSERENNISVEKKGKYAKIPMRTKIGFLGKIVHEGMSIKDVNM